MQSLNSFFCGKFASIIFCVLHPVQLNQSSESDVCHAVTFCFISGGLIPLVVSLLEIIRNNMFAAVTFATVSHWGLHQILLC